MQIHWVDSSICMLLFSSSGLGELVPRSGEAAAAVAGLPVPVLLSYQHAQPAYSSLVVQQPTLVRVGRTLLVATLFTLAISHMAYSLYRAYNTNIQVGGGGATRSETQ